MSDTPRKWSEAAALAAIPFLGCAYAFAFELGFMLHYNLPYWLIRFSLIQVIVTVAAMVIAYMVAMNIAGVLPSGPWRGIVSTMFELVMAIGLLVLWAGMLNWHRWLGRMIGGLLALFVLRYVIQLVVWRIIKPIRFREGTWLERWSADRQGIDSRKATDLQARVFSSTSALAISPEMHTWGWVVCGLVPIGVMYMATWVASQQREFQVMSQPAACVVLRAYNDEVICEPFDSTRKG
jgi:hypothetical protein